MAIYNNCGDIYYTHSTNSTIRMVDGVQLYGEMTKKISLKDLRDTLTGDMGVAVIRCGHCGQWGARFCECRKCGAPIE